MPKTARRHTGPRLAREFPEPVLTPLQRIHSLGQRINGWGGVIEREVIAFLAKQLMAGEVCLARYAHELLMASASECLKQCGYIEPEDAALLAALKDFAGEHGWVFENAAWREAAPLPEVAHA